METQSQSESRTQACPHCQATIPVYAGFKSWCECGWNLAADQADKPDGMYERIYVALNRKYSQALFEKFKARGISASAWSWSRLLAYSLAGLVHAVTAAIVLFAVYLGVWAFPTARPLGILLGLVCLAIVGFVLLPWPARPLRSGNLPRQQYPRLHALIDNVSQALHSPQLSRAAFDVHYNASFRQVGWRRRWQLVLGLSLWSVLEPQEKVALLAHELAHGVNGDPLRGWWVGGALGTLSNWYGLLSGYFRQSPGSGLGGIFQWLFNLVALPFSWLVFLLGYGLVHLLWMDCQRCEYQADILSAQVAGSEAAAGVLKKTVLYPTFQNTLQATYFNKNRTNFFATLKSWVYRAPDREIERLLRLERMAEYQVRATHPTASNRLAIMQTHPVPTGTVRLSAIEGEMLDTEIAPLLESVHQKVFTLDEINFKELFGLEW